MSPPVLPANSREITEFWFSAQVRPLWFDSNEEFDQQLKSRFEPLYKAAHHGELEAWQASAEGILALIIILDQFPLNMYRDMAESFATEKQAQALTKLALQHGYDEQLNNEQKIFLYMPLMHSEDIADQDLSVSLYEKAGMTENLKFAKHHRDIVQRFGRFPHRNTVLGRSSNEEELAYLNSDDAFRG